MNLVNLRKLKTDKLVRKVQKFIWDNKDLILKGKSRYEGCHELWGTCYPAAWFLSHLLWEMDIPNVVARKKMNEYGNHTYVLIEKNVSYLRPDDMEICYYTERTVADPTADQVPEGFDYLTGWKKSSPMISKAKMPHKMTRKLLELWQEEVTSI